MTKANRRRQRPGTQPPNSRPAGSSPSSSAKPPSSASQTGATPASSPSAGRPVTGATAGAAGAGAAATTAAATTAATGSSTAGPAGTAAATAATTSPVRPRPPGRRALRPVPAARREPAAANVRRVVQSDRSSSGTGRDRRSCCRRRCRPHRGVRPVLGRPARLRLHQRLDARPDGIADRGATPPSDTSSRTWAATTSPGSSPIPTARLPPDRISTRRAQVRSPARLRSGRRGQAAGLDPQPRARRSRRPVPRR